MELPGMIRRASDSQCQSEEILVSRQSVISEIKMASILRTTHPPRKSDPAVCGSRRLTPAIEERQSKYDQWKKVRGVCVE